jgi:chemotaxis protein CheX
MNSTEPTLMHKIDPKLIVPFVNSVRLVMKKMTGLAVTVGPSTIRTNPGTEFDYSGIIAFSGGIVGTVVVSFHRDAAVRIVAAFVKREIEPGSPNFADALGELTNMIAGAAKKEFGTNASISMPSVVMGAGHVIARPSDVPCVSVPCSAAGASFAVELSIRMA